MVKFTWLDPKRVTVETDVVRKLATVKNIDFMALSDTLIYTVPTGTKFIFTGFVLRAKTFDNLGLDGTANFKRGSDNIPLCSIVSGGFPEVGSSAYHVLSYLDFQNIYIVSAGDTVRIEITNADTGTALTFDVDLIGYLIKKYGN